MKKNKNWLFLVLSLVLLLGLGQAAQAVLVDLGPPNNNTTTGTGTPAGVFGYPLWYQDSNDLRLELCLPNAAELAAGACLFLAADLPTPGDPIAFPTNFPGESFWFVAEAPLPAPADGLLTLALEAAFSNEIPIEGDQVSFGRLRYRIVTPGPGTYTVTTPYGIFTEVVPLGETVINTTRDIGIGSPGVFTGALNSDIGPFLRASLTPGGAPLPFFTRVDLPGQYLFDPNLTTPVTGGTTGNIFSVVGPGLNAQTDQFSLIGRVSSGLLPTSLSGVRATYSKPAVGTGFVEVLANSSTTAVLTTAAAEQIPATIMLTDPGTGRFSSRVPITPSTILPASLTVTADNSASNPFNTPTTLGANLTDLVNVTLAEHDPFTRTLTIQAASSDEVSPPALTALGFGNLVSGKLTVNNIISHPGTVTVTSSKGGSGTRQIISIDPVSNTRATYCRPAVGNGLVTVFATSSPTAALTINDPTGRIPTTNMDTNPNSGTFFADIPLIPIGSTILPANLIITATSPTPGIAPVSIGVDLVDVVTIGIAEYVPLEKTLTILATSCDALAPPVLSAVGFGNLPSGYLKVNDVNAPPSVITVNSSAGGSDNKEVNTGSLRRYLPAISKP